MTPHTSANGLKSHSNTGSFLGANQAGRVEVNHDPLPVACQVADEHGTAAVPLDAMEFAAVRTEAGDGRWLRFDVVFILKLLPVKFSEAGEVQDASHLRISDVKNPRQNCAGVGENY